MRNVVPRLLDEHDEFESADYPVDVEGLSSPRVCGLLNALVAEMPPNEHYLEVGTWKGLTLLSAAHGNDGKQCFGCDLFRLWGPSTGFGPLAKMQLRNNLRYYRSECGAIDFHAIPFQDLFMRGEIDPPVGVYFYDADHTYEGTYEGVEDAYSYLAEESYILMDDWNDETIREATYAAFRDLQLTINWQVHLPGDHDEEMWWNGLGVFHLKK